MKKGEVGARRGQGTAVKPNPRITQTRQFRRRCPDRFVEIRAAQQQHRPQPASLTPLTWGLAWSRIPELFELITAGQGDAIQEAERAGVPVHEQAWRFDPMSRRSHRGTVQQISPRQIAVALAGLQDCVAYVSAIATAMLLQSMEAREGHDLCPETTEHDEDYEDVAVDEPEEPEPEETALVQRHPGGQALRPAGREGEMREERSVRMRVWRAISATSHPNTGTLQDWQSRGGVRSAGPNRLCCCLRT